MDELKPCPFCGSPGVFKTEGPMSNRVFCPRCYAAITGPDATKEWNRRYDGEANAEAFKMLDDKDALIAELRKEQAGVIEEINKRHDAEIAEKEAAISKWRKAAVEADNEAEADREKARKLVEALEKIKNRAGEICGDESRRVGHQYYAGRVGVASGLGKIAEEALKPYATETANEERGGA